jgi:protein Tex
MKPINRRIAEELGVREQQVAAAISLLDNGATVPFVARYRKEATGALDDAQLRTLEERLRYLRELDERRAAILDSISQQGKLDVALKQARSGPRAPGRRASCEARPEPGRGGSPIRRTE